MITLARALVLCSRNGVDPADLFASFGEAPTYHAETIREWIGV